jgi:hypothetical protein
MVEKLTHQETAELIDRYHQRAKEIYESGYGFEVKIVNIKNVQILETGAFVEAMVWVPKNEL